MFSRVLYPYRPTFGTAARVLRSGGRLAIADIISERFSGYANSWSGLGVPGSDRYNDLAGARDLEVRDPAPPLVRYRRYQLDALALEFRDGALDVMTHEEQAAMPRSPAPTGARVDRELTRRQGEDQPAIAGIDTFEAQHAT